MPAYSLPIFTLQFMQLQNELIMRQMAEDPQLQPRRRSIAMGAVPNMVHGFSRDG